MMLRTIQAGRTAGLAGLAALAFTALPALAPAGAAQEKEEERRGLRAFFRTDVDDRSGRPMLGVMLERGEDDGVLVANVLEDSPAQEVGIMQGDLILSVNGHDLSEPLEGEDERDFNPARSRPEERLRALVSEVPEGETVTLVVERDGEEIDFAVVPEVLPGYGALGPLSEQLEEQFRGLGEWWSDEEQRQATLERIRELTERFRSQERPYEWDAPGWVPPGSLRIFTDTLASGPWQVRWGGSRGAHGLDLVELNPGLGAYFGTTEGVLVADVEDDSPLGLLPGDVVVAVDGRMVDDIDEMHRILDSYKSDEEIALRIFRDGAQTTVTGTIN